MTGEEHKAIRRSLRISQARWGVLMGVGRVAVCDWERDKYAIPGSVEQWALELQEVPEALFRLERRRGLRQ